MRVVCLITIGAFLICVSTADNQIKQKRSSKNIHHQSHHRRLRQLSNGDQRLSHHGKQTRSVDSSARSDSFSPLKHSGNSGKNDVDNSILKTAAEHVGELDDEEPIYLEPVFHRHEKSWLDKLRSILDIKVEPQKNSGALIGPLTVAGLGKKVYIRHPGQFDDDAERIYVHIVTKEIPELEDDDDVEDNDVSSEAKDGSDNSYTKTVHPPAAYAVAASASSFGRALPEDQEHWASSHKQDTVAKAEKEVKHELVITPRKSSVSRSDTGPEESARDEEESKFTMVLIKHAGQKPPSVVWSKPVHRRMPLQTYTRRQRQSVHRRKAPRKPQPQPTRKRQPTRLKVVKTRTRQTTPKPSKSIKYSQPIAPLHHDLYNNTEATSETSFTGGFQPVTFTEQDVVTWKPTSFTDAISLATESSLPIYVTRSRQQSPVSTTAKPDPKSRFRYRTVSRPLVKDTSNDWKEFKPSQGGLQVVSAPNLTPAEKRSAESSNSHNNVVQSIMTMTASQIWETRQKVDSDYKNSDTFRATPIAQDRMDKFDEFEDYNTNEKESESEIVSVLPQQERDLGSAQKKLDTYKMGEELWRNIRNSQPWTLQLKLLKSEEEVVNSRVLGKPDIISDRDHSYDEEIVPDNHRKEP